MPATAASRYALSNPIERIADKPRHDLTREDLLRVIADREIEYITLHYTALDGKYKELRLPIADERRAERILAQGERVDGSSLFRGLVETTLSDLYVAPVYHSAFLNPFDDRSLDLTCRFMDSEGNLFAYAPGSVLHRAARLLGRTTHLELRALGELEFFLLSERGSPLYPAPRQRGYHESAPFVKSGELLAEMMTHLERITGAVKYAHTELGTLASVQSDLEEINGKCVEQLEIEFLPQPVEECGDTLVLARWIIRNVAFRHGCVATFAPKIEEGVAGNGMHVHMEVARHGRNIMRNARGLSDEARRLIGGLCHYAESLTAFGNTVSSAYLRLVPNQEAPTRVCWSDHNRSAMVRVPLGWSGIEDLAAQVNAQQKRAPAAHEECQTVELRTPDGSAIVHLLLAGMAMAVQWGLTHEQSLALATRTYVPAGGFTDEALASLPALPRSCVESARHLREKRALYERESTFPSQLVDYVAGMLEAEDDEDMNARLANLPADDRLRETRKIMHKDLHRH